MDEKRTLLNGGKVSDEYLNYLNTIIKSNDIIINKRRKMSTAKKAVFVIIALGLLLVGGITFAKGGDAKQNTFNSATCNNNVANVYVGYNKSGSQITFSAGAHQDTTGLTWHVTAVDAGVTLVDQSFPYPSTDWSILANYTSPKGDRTVVVTVATVDGSVTCVQNLNYKV